MTRLATGASPKVWRVGLCLLALVAMPAPSSADAHDAPAAAEADSDVDDAAAAAKADPEVDDAAERPLGPGTSRTAGRIVDRERDPLSLRIWTTALYAHQAIPDDVAAERIAEGLPPLRMDLAIGGVRLVADYNRRARREGVYARADGLFEHRFLTPDRSFTDRPVAGSWHSRPDRYRLADAHVGYRSGPYSGQIGRSVLHQVGYQMVDGAVGRYRSGAFSGTLFGGLSPHPYTLQFDPRFVTAGAGAGWMGPTGGMDLGAAMVLFEGAPDRLTLTQRGHLRAGPEGLAFHSLVVLDALTAVGIQVRMLSLSTDYVPVSRSRVGLTLSHFGAPLPGAFATRYDIEEQLFADVVHDADYISNRALFAAVPRTNLRLYGILGLSDAVVLYGLGNVQRRTTPQVALNASIGPDDEILDPRLVGGINNAAGATIGARSFQRHAGISADVSYSYLVGFISDDQLANVHAGYELPNRRFGVQLGATRIHTLQQQAIAELIGRPDGAGPHIRWQLFGQITGRPLETVAATVMYRTLLGEQAPHHTAFLRVEYRY